MYRCTCSCSTRALEAFVADLAGISIKSHPQRLQRSVRHLHAVAQAERTVDSITLQTPASETLQRSLRMIELAPVLDPVPRVDETKGTSTSREDENGKDASSTRTKAESRMLRKLKRIQGGSHNKHGIGSEKLVHQVEAMLQKIEESPQVLVDLVQPKVEAKAESKKENARQRKPASKGKWVKGKWVQGRRESFRGKSATARTEGSKVPSAEARKENTKEHIANQRAGEETVEVGDEAAWEHVQDEWTEEPKWQADEPIETRKTARKEKVSGKQSDVNGIVSEDDVPPKPQEPWGIQKSALERKFGERGWQPRKRLSPDTLSGIRALHASNPTIYNVEMLREHFKITPEAIRRILKSKWRPSSEEIEDRMQRWEKRGVRKWSEMAEQGQKPPKKWRVLGVPNPKLGQRKAWDSNSGVARKEKTTEEEGVQDEELVGKARRMETAQRTRFKESLAGRIL